MASLFEAIVLQNLSVLTRGHILMPKVLLLGGPNTFIPGMRQAWQAHIPRIWRERGIELPAGTSVEEQVFCPPDGVYYAALGAVEFGREQEVAAGFAGAEALETQMSRKPLDDERCGIAGTARIRYRVECISGALRGSGEARRRVPLGRAGAGFLGLDGGSTLNQGRVGGRRRRGARQVLPPLPRQPRSGRR